MAPFTVGRFLSLSNDLNIPYNIHPVYIVPSSLPFCAAVHFDIPSALCSNLYAYLFGAFFPTPCVYLLSTFHLSSSICYRPQHVSVTSLLSCSRVSSCVHTVFCVCESRWAVVLNGQHTPILVVSDCTKHGTCTHVCAELALYRSSF
jgi:hypothetical protein